MTATQIRQFHDLDLFVDMLAADKDHIDRAKAKAEAVRLAQEQARKDRQRRAVEQARKDRQRRAVEQARATRRMEITASSTVALSGVWLFLAAWLA